MSKKRKQRRKHAELRYTNAKEWAKSCETDYIRCRPSRIYRELKLTRKFRAFVKEQVEPLVTLEGKKLEQKRKLLAHIANNLIVAGLVHKVVSDTRNTRLPGVRIRVYVWDAVERAGLHRKAVGSELARKVTRYRVTEKLLSLRKEWKLDLLVNTKLARNTELVNPTRFGLVYIHSGKRDLNTGELLPANQRKQPVHFQKFFTEFPGEADDKSEQLEHFKKIEDRLEFINRSNTAHGWQAFETNDETGKQHVRPVDPTLRQLHSGRPFIAARLYGIGELQGQSLSKDQRRSMLIDGEPTAELDYSGMAIRMLYHIAGRNPKGDAYRPERILPKVYRIHNANKERLEILRTVIKKATNICLNVDSRTTAVRAVRWMIELHRHGPFLRRALYGIEDLDSPEEFIQRIVDAHPRVRDEFFTNCGSGLMTIDGQIMLMILHKFAKAKKPALGIHDSIVCKASDAEFARQTMEAAYRRKLNGFDPVIKRVF